MKKYLSMICALLTLMAFTSCGDSKSNSDSSEVSEISISEITTELETEPETTSDETKTQKPIQEKTTKAKKINVKNNIGDILFKIPDGYKKENNQSDESMEAVTYTYDNGGMINISRQSAEQYGLSALNDLDKKIVFEAFMSSALSGYFDTTGDLETVTIAGEFAIKQNAVYSGTTIPLTAYVFAHGDNLYSFMLTNMVDNQQEIMESINIESPNIKKAREKKKEKETIIEKPTEMATETITEKTLSNGQILDKTYKSDGISFDYCSEWKEYDSKFWAPAFTIENNFRIITRYQTGDFGNISNEKYIEQKKQEFNEKNRPYEIIINKNGYEIFSYLQTDFIKCFGCANGKAVFTVEFKNYSEKYNDIVNKIIDSIQIVSYGMSNPMKSENEKVTQPVTEPPTEKAPETQPPVIETSPVYTVLHFVLNLETSCIHINPDCSAALKILPENYSTVDITDSDLSNYNGIYWACGKCSEDYTNVLPKF